MEGRDVKKDDGGMRRSHTRTVEEGVPGREFGDIIRVLLGERGTLSGDLMLVGDSAASSSCTTFAMTTSHKRVC